MSAVHRRILPGLHLSLGYTVTYLSLLVLIPLGACFLKASSLSFSQFWRAVATERALHAYGLTFGDVIEALERNNVATGAGFIEHGGEAYVVRPTGLIERESQIGRIVVGERRGTPIYVSDVAEVGIGRELRSGSASENGREVVVGTAMMLIGANSRTVAAAVDERVRQIASAMPPVTVGCSPTRHSCCRRKSPTGCWRFRAAVTTAA